MDQACTICSKPFDSQKYVPMIVCLQQHYYCLKCVNIILGQRSRPTCPQCRQELRRQNIVRFRLYQKCSQKMKEKIKNLTEDFNKKITQRQHIITEQTCTILKQLVLTNFGGDAKGIRSTIKSKVEVFMNKGMYEVSITLLKRVIQAYPQSYEEDFLGLGSKEEQKEFCENCSYSWYQHRHCASNISLEDILAIAFLRTGNYKRQVGWYQHMYWNISQSMRILYGLALAEHNQNKEEKALSIYKKIIDKWPRFDKPYQMIAFIYIKQKDYIQATKYSRQCLDLSQENVFALYIQAVANMDRLQHVSEYILEQVLRKQPNYNRAKMALGECTLKVEEKIKQQKAIQQRLQQHCKQNFNPNKQHDNDKNGLQQIKKVPSQLYPSFFLDICIGDFINRQENLPYYEGVKRFNEKRHQQSLIAFSNFIQPESIFFHNYHLIFISISYLKLKDYESSFRAAAKYLACSESGLLLNIAHKIVIFCCKKLEKSKEADKWNDHWTYSLRQVHEVDDKMQDYLLRIQINQTI